MENVMRLDLTIGTTNSDGKIVKGTERDITILYNKTVITYAEVKELINSDIYEYDNRIIVTTPTRADNLRSK